MNPVRFDTEREAKTLGLRSAATLQTTRSYRVIGVTLAVVAVAILIVLFLPWQQTVRGNGTVIAFSPEDRPQVLPSRIDGRIDQFLVAEGAFVTKGTPVVQISETKDEYLDPQLLRRTVEERNAKALSNSEKREKAAALERMKLTLDSALIVKRQQAATYISNTRALLQ
ncbi:MAG: hypothetical protein ACO1Q7_01885, partial [Gemmatimonas sp.]